MYTSYKQGCTPQFKDLLFQGQSPLLRQLLVIQWNFKDEDVVDSFLITMRIISSRLTSSDVSWILEPQADVSKKSEEDYIQFPFFLNVMQFFKHKDPNVRTVVKQTTLNIFNLQSEEVSKILTQQPYQTYFSDLIEHLNKSFLIFEEKLRKFQAVQLQANNSSRDLQNSQQRTPNFLQLEQYMEEVEDQLLYINDVLTTCEPKLQQFVRKQFQEIFIEKSILNPLQRAGDMSGLRSTMQQMMLGNTQREISVSTALHGLEKIFLIVKHQPVVSKLACQLLGPKLTKFTTQYSHVVSKYQLDEQDQSSELHSRQRQLSSIFSQKSSEGQKEFQSLLSGTYQHLYKIENSDLDSRQTSEGLSNFDQNNKIRSKHTQQHSYPQANLLSSTQQLFNAFESMRNIQTSPAVEKKLCDPGPYREILLSILKGESQESMEILRVLAAIIQNQNIEHEVLDYIGLLPQFVRVQAHKHVVDTITSYRRHTLNSIRSDYSTFFDHVQSQNFRRGNSVNNLEHSPDDQQNQLQTQKKEFFRQLLYSQESSGGFPQSGRNSETKSTAGVDPFQKFEYKFDKAQHQQQNKAIDKGDSSKQSEQDLDLADYQQEAIAGQDQTDGNGSHELTLSYIGPDTYARLFKKSDQSDSMEGEEIIKNMQKTNENGDGQGQQRISIQDSDTREKNQQLQEQALRNINSTSKDDLRHIKNQENDKNNLYSNQNLSQDFPEEFQKALRLVSIENVEKALQMSKEDETQEVVLRTDQTASLVDNLMGQAIWSMISQDTGILGNYWLQNTINQGPPEPQSEELSDVLFSILEVDHYSNPPSTIMCIWLIKELFQQEKQPLNIQTDSVVNSLQDSAFQNSSQRKIHLNNTQRKKLKSFYDKCRYDLTEAIQQNWCDSLHVLMGQDWEKLRQALLNPNISNVRQTIYYYVYTTLNSPRLIYKPQTYIDFMGRRSSNDFGDDAQSATRTYEIVQRSVIAYQAEQYFKTGTISEKPPFDTINYEDLAKMQIVEGQNRQLKQDVSFSCMVAFLKGQERQVYLTIGGFPIRKLDYDQESGQDRVTNISQIVNMFSPAVPMCVLVLPKQVGRLEGKVISIAPLMGSQIYVDSEHPKWLHIHVRPHVTILAELLSRIELAWRDSSFLVPRMKRIKGGHWVLSFGDPEKALRAQKIIHQHIQEIRFYYHEMWKPFLYESKQEDNFLDGTG